jgi:hypothetical protein
MFWLLRALATANPSPYVIRHKSRKGQVEGLVGAHLAKRLLYPVPVGTVLLLLTMGRQGPIPGLKHAGHKAFRQLSGG